jgi:hypothetical protein
MSFDTFPEVTYSTIDDYYTYLQVTDYNGCVVGKTKFVGVSEPNTCYPNTKIYADIDNYDNVYFTKKACSITFYPGYLFDNACYYGDFCPYVDDGRWWIYKKISNNGPYYFESGPSGFMYIGCTYGIQYEDYLNTSECPYALFNCSILDSRYCFGFAESGIFKVKLRLENRRPLHHPSGYVYEGTDIKYVHVVDCNTNSGLITNGGDLSNDVNYWGNNYSAGSFWLRANDNNYINNNDVILTACNKIEMYDGFDTGVSGLFVAQTGNDIFQDCASCSGYKNDISFDDDFTDTLTTKYININIFPNPFYNNLDFEMLLYKGGFTEIEIYNIEGKKIKTLLNRKLKADKEYNLSFNIKDIVVGIYLCKIIQNGNIIFSKKLIKNQ